jgi:methionine-rich copper-binding protein CopC
MLTVASVAAQAHASLEQADPGAGTTVRTMPGQLTLRFSQPIERAFSTVKVTDAKGQAVDKGDIHVDGATMRVSLATVGAGNFTVAWRAVSADSHVKEGHFVFHVAP